MVAVHNKIALALLLNRAPRGRRTEPRTSELLVDNSTDPISAALERETVRRPGPAAFACIPAPAAFVDSSRSRWHYTTRVHQSPPRREKLKEFSLGNGAALALRASGS
jgi:hypothetical protein